MTKVVIPKTVNEIGRGAFGKNPGLKTFALVDRPNESNANVEIIRNPNNEKITIEEGAFPQAIMEMIGNEGLIKEEVLLDINDVELVR